MARLAQAGLMLFAAKTNTNKVTITLARLSASKSLLSLLEGGGVCRRLALAGGRPETRCVLVDQHGGGGGRLLGSRYPPSPKGAVLPPI